MLTYIFTRSMLLDNTEANHESITDRSRHQVQFAGRVDVGQQLFVQLVYLLTRMLGVAHETETNQSQL